MRTQRSYRFPREAEQVRLDQPLSIVQKSAGGPGSSSPRSGRTGFRRLQRTRRRAAAIFAGGTARLKVGNPSVRPRCSPRTTHPLSEYRPARAAALADSRSPPAIARRIAVLETGDCHRHSPARPRQPEICAPGRAAAASPHRRCDRVRIRDRARSPVRASRTGRATRVRQTGPAICAAIVAVEPKHKHPAHIARRHSFKSFRRRS